MNKKIVSIIVIGLLLTISLASVNAFQNDMLNEKVSVGSPETNDPNVNVHETHDSYIDIYVDDDNTEGPWDGTIEHPYRYIVDGYENASAGDTIFVFSGFYDEVKELVLSKSINLVGEDRDSTIINWSMQEDYVDSIIVRGFTIKGQGITLFHSSFHKICDNIFLGVRGVCFSNCSNSIISDNIFSTSQESIYLRYRACNNIVSGKIFF